jgi:predicted nucleic acid-binding protein
MTSVVSDSTTLIVLGNLKRFELLSNLFSTIYIPKSVHKELTYKKIDELPSFIKVEDVASSKDIDMLNLLLDKGESEAIALALQKETLLVIDEKKGRKIAKNMGLNIIGLLGIFYLNIKKDFISKEESLELLDECLKNGFRISQKLIDDFRVSLQ